MRLKELLPYENIVIQCHNNPDADAIASGFGLYQYFKYKGKNPRFVYGGKEKMQKANLCLMVDELNIPIEYVQKLDKPELLITVDCQYGEGNVENYEAENVAIIDHHQVSVDLPPLHEVRSNLASCSTVVWDMLKKEAFHINDDKALATALYYGLMMDSNTFAEVFHPLDRDVRDEANCDRNLITRFRTTNLSLEELEIAGKALQEYQYEPTYKYSIVKTEPCDPNILGMISDLALEVDVVETCLVYAVLPFGIKVSVRSCVKEVKACDLVKFIVEGIGTGGGHLEKAGGFIQIKLLPCKIEEIGDYFKKRMDEYFSGVQIIYAKNYEAELSETKIYKKRPVPVGYVKGTDIFPSGTKVNIRTLEGDVDVELEEDIYIMIGIEGEIYPIRKEKFERSYRCLEEPYVFDGEYAPTIKDVLEGKAKSLVQHAKSCVPTGEVIIYAKPLEQRVKVFTSWDEEKYMAGNPGDYLAVRKDDLQDVYVIEKNIFKRTYEEV